ncbi:MAG: threonylcarbamoyl-AMP synthase [Chloroflexi bacterium]|nr:threonylcarbamoyl-AMP synthase [Chloroflexota bacterium]
MIQTIPLRSPVALVWASEILRTGGVIAFPTDTVYGLAAMAFDAQAVQRLYIIKGRTTDKSIPVLVGQLTDLAKVAASLPQAAEKLARAFWPGALTLVVPKHSALPKEVASGNTVGARMPDHPSICALMRLTGPLAVTSANRSGSPNPLTAEDVMAQLDGYVDLLLLGGACPGGQPSTVVDCTANPPAILRHGPVTDEAIFAIVNRSQ